MSADERLLADRCTARYAHDSLGRGLMCEFVAGHVGLHSVAREWRMIDEPTPLPEPIRWGTQAQLDEEIARTRPSGILTLEVTADDSKLRDAIRRAIRLQGGGVDRRAFGE